MQITRATCTQEGMSASQPGIGCSLMSGNGEHVLHVYRYYPNLVNGFGGLGVFKHCDAYGMKFATSKEAWAYALDHGYIRVYQTSAESRAHHLRQAELYREWGLHQSMERQIRRNRASAG